MTWRDIYLNVYPNVFPFNGWESLTLQIEDPDPSFLLEIRDSQDDLVFKEVIEIDNNIDTIEWDISSAKLV